MPDEAMAPSQRGMNPLRRKAKNGMTMDVNPTVNACHVDYLAAKDYYARSRRREVKNWRMFWGTDSELGLGQWNAESVQFMREQKRLLVTHNMIMPIVDEIAAGMMEHPMEPELYPVGGGSRALCDAIMGAYRSDKEQCDWGHSEFEMIRAMLVHAGTIRMAVTTEYDDAGNIALPYCLPGSVTWSPRWRTMRCGDAVELWYETWHTAADIGQHLYPKKWAQIWGEMEMTGNRRFGDNLGITPRNELLDDRAGDEHKLIRHYRMVEKTRKVEYAITDDGRIEIPAHIPNDMKIAWLNMYHPTWNPETVREDTKTDKVCMVRAICPSLLISDVLDDSPAELQIGTLPFWTVSAARANGEVRSIVDAATDPQIQINYMAALSQYKIQIEGGGGAQFADASMFESENEYQRYLTERNDPSSVFRMKPGMMSKSSPVKAVEHSDFPNEVYKNMDHLINNILPRVARSPAVRQGVSNPGDSGDLYDSKVIQADRAVFVIHQGLSLMRNELYGGYFMGAIDLYAKECLERVMSYNRGRESVTLNERVDVPQADGSVVEGIKNDVGKLKDMRIKVIIGEDNASPTQKVENLNTSAKMMKAMGTYGPATAQVLMTEISKNMPGIQEDVRDVLVAVGEKELKLKVLEVEANISKTENAVFDYRQQLKQKMEEAAQREMMEAQQGQGAMIPGRLEGGQQLQGAPMPQPQPQAQAPQPPQGPPPSQAGAKPTAVRSIPSMRVAPEPDAATVVTTRAPGVGQPAP